MVRVRVEANGRQKLLLTDAQTIQELWEAVERRLDVKIATLASGRALIEDDEDVRALLNDDELQVEVQESSDGAPLDDTDFLENLLGEEDEQEAVGEDEQADDVGPEAGLQVSA